MKSSIVYERTIRVKPYETVKVGLMVEVAGEGIPDQRKYEAVKAQVDFWADQAREEFGVDE